MSDKKEGYETYRYNLSQSKMAKTFLNQPLEIDQRKLKTETKLFHALVQFYQSQMIFSQISIQQLCSAAGVSRATFYRHHDSLRDVIIVECLTVINQFQQNVDTKSQINFDVGSQLLIALLYQHLDLFQLIVWSDSLSQVTDLFSGAVQQILRLREAPPTMQRFISRFTGTAILNFAVQIATSEDAISQTDALTLFRLLIPNQVTLPKKP